MPIIRVENLSKSYRLGQIGSSTLRDDLSRAWAKLRKQPDPLLRIGQEDQVNRQGETIWALRDVSFEIEQGEVLGIIGRNGAGKSTLLKILSRVTAPTSGVVKVKGRIASLLEVGTGFHPELTGRENIFLNGAILGMSRDEVKRKFDEIVDFSGVEKFIDTPVKRYSSGMYVRLAFAVAAHLDPEILLVDEVLAVGDVEFQKKCLGKMENISDEGRTILFVSHNMNAITRLCKKAVLIDQGQITNKGLTDKVIYEYLNGSHGKTSIKQWEPKIAPGNQTVRLLCVFAHDSYGNTKINFKISEEIFITMEYEVLQNGKILVPTYNFYNDRNINLFDSHEIGGKWHRKPKTAGTYSSTVFVPKNFFAEGLIFIGCGIVTYDPLTIHFHEREIIVFNVSEEGNYLGNTARGDYTGTFPGVVRPLLSWETKKI
jgi:lipopolysaccharide transport system ATP-binding protein